MICAFTKNPLLLEVDPKQGEVAGPDLCLVSDEPSELLDELA
jgi:hypothetical protein